MKVSLSGDLYNQRKKPGKGRVPQKTRDRKSIEKAIEVIQVKDDGFEIRVVARWMDIKMKDRRYLLIEYRR